MRPMTEEEIKKLIPSLHPFNGGEDEEVNEEENDE